MSYCGMPARSSGPKVNEGDRWTRQERLASDALGRFVRRWVWLLKGEFLGRQLQPTARVLNLLCLVHAVFGPSNLGPRVAEGVLRAFGRGSRGTGVRIVREELTGKSSGCI